MSNKALEISQESVPRDSLGRRKATGRPRGSTKFSPNSFLKSGFLPKEKEHFAQMADEAVHRIADDLGGVANLGGGQIVILREIRQLLIYQFMVEKMLTPGQTFESKVPLNNFLLTTINTIIRCINQLGLGKIAKQDIDSKANEESDIARLTRFLQEGLVVEKKEFPSIFDHGYEDLLDSVNEQSG